MCGRMRVHAAPLDRSAGERTVQSNIPLGLPVLAPRAHGNQLNSLSLAKRRGHEVRRTSAITSCWNSSRACTLVMNHHLPRWRVKMRGSDGRNGSHFSYVDLEHCVPPAHPLRVVRRIADEVLADMSGAFEAAYAPLSRPSIPTERLLHTLLLLSFCRAQLERQLKERLGIDDQPGRAALPQGHGPSEPAVSCRHAAVGELQWACGGRPADAGQWCLGGALGGRLGGPAHPARRYAGRRQGLRHRRSCRRAPRVPYHTARCAELI